MKKDSVEYYVWNKGWRDIEFLRVALRDNVLDQFDDEIVRKTLGSISSRIINTISGNVPFIGGSRFELKSMLNTELKEHSYINYEI
jgi:hypothetical protein